MTRVVNRILIVVLLAGVVALVAKRSRLNFLIAEQTRLNKICGLDPDHPTSAFATRIDIDDPFAIRWRIPGSNEISKIQSIIFVHGCFVTGGTTSTPSSETLQEQFFNFRFKFSESSLWLHKMRGSTTSRSGTDGPIVLDKDLVEFLRRHWNEMEFETENTGDEQLIRYRINYPPHLMPAWSAQFGDVFKEQYAVNSMSRAPFPYRETTFIEIVLGTPEAIAPYLPKSMKRGLEP